MDVSDLKHIFSSLSINVKLTTFSSKHNNSRTLNFMTTLSVFFALNDVRDRKLKMCVPFRSWNFPDSFFFFFSSFALSHLLFLNEKSSLPWNTPECETQFSLMKIHEWKKFPSRNKTRSSSSFCPFKSSVNDMMILTEQKTSGRNKKNHSSSDRFSK